MVSILAWAIFFQFLRCKDKQSFPNKLLFKVIFHLSSDIFIECVAQNASKSGPHIILIELLDSHYRSVILSREPTAAFAVVSHRSRLRLSRVQASLTLRSACTRSFGTAEVAGVATRVS